MPDEIQVGSPQHEQIRAEYGEALKSGDPAKIEAAGKKYEAFGNKPADTGGGVSAGPAPTEDEADASYEAEALKICDEECRAAFGAEYDSRMAGVQAVAEELFNTPELRQAAGRIESALIESGVSLSQINLLLDRIARRGK